jgi:hypothetical protein
MTPYPLINGHRFDWSSVRVTIDGVPYTGVKSINYRQSLTPSVVRGTRAQPTGRTRGIYEPEGSIELYKEDYQDIIQALSKGGTQGYMEVAFQVLVQYSSGILPVVTDTLAGVRLASDEDSPAEGGDAFTVNCDLSIMYVLRNGLSALSPDQLLR